MIRTATIFLLTILCTLPQRAFVQNTASIREKIERLAQEKRAEIGVAVIIDGKDTVTCNNDHRYPMMSVFKFHQALAVADYLQRNGGSLDATIHIDQSDLRPDTYSPLRERFPEGNIDLTIRELLTYTLQQSDNNACDILFARIMTPKETDRTIRSWGINDFAISADENEMHRDLTTCYDNWSTPLAAAELLERFITGRTIGKPYAGFIRRTMEECTTGEKRLAAPLIGQTVLFGHKTGTGDRNEQGEFIGINDIGFVSLRNGHRYVIAVFVKDSQESYADTEKIIADISAIVFNEINTLKE